MVNDSYVNVTSDIIFELRTGGEITLWNNLLSLQNKQKRERERKQQQQQANNMQVLSKTQKSRERLDNTTTFTVNLCVYNRLHIVIVLKNTKSWE